MRRSFFTVCLLTLLSIGLFSQRAWMASPSQLRALFNSSPQSAEVAKIKAYHDEIDAYAKAHPTAVRYFSDASEVNDAGVETSHWKEYKTRKELPDLQTHASVWMKDGKVVATILSFKSDHTNSTDGYYYRADGTLAYTESHGYSIGLDPPFMQGKSFYTADGQLIRSTLLCSVDEQKWETCKEDSGWKDSGEGKATERYLKNTDLPFYKLLLPSNASAFQDEGTRVRFQRGSSSAILKGTVAKGGPDIYLVGGRSGQTMTVKATGKVSFGIDAPNATMTPDDSNTNWTGVLAAYGDYKIRVYSSGGVQNYSLTISIVSAPPESSSPQQQ